VSVGCICIVSKGVVNVIRRIAIAKTETILESIWVVPSIKVVVPRRIPWVVPVVKSE
tara:strand:+ start:1212 stop:1382 length:171 start_codon:yes stop_codon:yes gene_type:complete